MIKKTKKKKKKKKNKEEARRRNKTREIFLPQMRYNEACFRKKRQVTMLLSEENLEF